MARMRGGRNGGHRRGRNRVCIPMATWWRNRHRRRRTGCCADRRTAAPFGVLGPITIVSDEDHLPYDRPPLSKEVLRAETDDVTLKPAEFYDEHDITMLLGRRRAVGGHRRENGDARRRQRFATTNWSSRRAWCPRIPSFPDLPGIHVLRSFDESLALRRHAGSARNAVVVGAGFIGCEVAASLRAGRRRRPGRTAARAAGIGARRTDRWLVARLHRAEGVDVRCGVGVPRSAGRPGREGRAQRRHRTRCRPRGRRHRVTPRHRLAGGHRHRGRQRRGLR